MMQQCGNSCALVGVSCVHIPEAHGGHGFGLEELGLVAEEMGRHLYCGPFFSSVVLASLALLSGARDDEMEPPRRHRRRPEIYTVVLGSLEDSSDLASAVAAEKRKGRHVTLSGKAAHVFDAHIADGFLVFATDAQGAPGLFHAEPQSTGLTVRSVASMDQTRRVSSVTFERTPAVKIGAAATST